MTLQPIRRFGFDAAILFANILMVPDALGQAVRFVEGERPRLDPMRSVGDLARLDGGRTAEKFATVAEPVVRVEKTHGSRRTARRARGLNCDRGPPRPGASVPATVVVAQRFNSCFFPV